MEQSVPVSDESLTKWCARRDSNPQFPGSKSVAFTNFATGTRKKSGPVQPASMGQAPRLGVGQSVALRAALVPSEPANHGPSRPARDPERRGALRSSPPQVDAMRIGGLESRRKREQSGNIPIFLPPNTRGVLNRVHLMEKGASEGRIR